MSAGPRIFFDPQSVAIRKERTAKMVEGRRVWLAILKAEGSKAPWGRKKKGAIPDPLSKPLARLTKGSERSTGKERALISLRKPASLQSKPVPKLSGRQPPNASARR